MTQSSGSLQAPPPFPFVDNYTACCADVAEVPVRVLDRLMVYGEDGGVVRMWSLDCQHSTLGVQSGTTSAPPSAIFARGTLKAPDEAAEVDAGLQGVHKPTPCRSS